MPLSISQLIASVAEKHLAPSPDCDRRLFPQWAPLPPNNIPCYFTPEPRMPPHPREPGGCSYRQNGKTSIIEFLMKNVTRLEIFTLWKWNDHFTVTDKRLCRNHSEEVSSCNLPLRLSSRLRHSVILSCIPFEVPRSHETSWFWRVYCCVLGHKF